MTNLGIFAPEQSQPTSTSNPWWFNPLIAITAVANVIFSAMSSSSAKSPWWVYAVMIVTAAVLLGMFLAMVVPPLRKWSRNVYGTRQRKKFIRTITPELARHLGEIAHMLAIGGSFTDSLSSAIQDAQRKHAGNANVESASDQCNIIKEWANSLRERWISVARLSNADTESYMREICQISRRMQAIACKIRQCEVDKGNWTQFEKRFNGFIDDFRRTGSRYSNAFGLPEFYVEYI